MHKLPKINLVCRALLSAMEPAEIADTYDISPNRIYFLGKQLKKEGITSTAQFVALTDEEKVRILYGNNARLEKKGDGEVSVVVPRERSVDPNLKMPNFEELAARQADSGVKSNTLYSEYRRECRRDSCSELSKTVFYRRLRSAREKLHKGKAVMVQQRTYGMAVMADYCGARFQIGLPDGKLQSCAILVLVWAASNLVYARIIPGMTTAATCEGIGAALRHWGVKPAVWVIDNARAMVDRHQQGKEAVFNDSFAYYMKRLGIEIDANTPFRPSEKSQAELSVRLVQDRVLPLMSQGLCLSFEEYNRELMKRVDSEINQAEFRANGTGTPRADLFEKYERPKAIPVDPAQIPVYAEHFPVLRVANDYTVNIKGARYSVPYRFIGKYVSADVRDGHIQIYHEGERIAYWDSCAEGAVQIEPGHMPPAHRAVHDKRARYPDADSIINTAASICIELASFCRGVLDFKGFAEGKKCCISLINQMQKKLWMLPEYREALKVTMQNPVKQWNSYTVKACLNEIEIYKLRHNGAFPVQTQLEFTRPLDYYSRGEGAFDNDGGNNNSANQGE